MTNPAGIRLDLFSLSGTGYCLYTWPAKIIIYFMFSPHLIPWIVLIILIVIIAIIIVWNVVKRVIESGSDDVEIGDNVKIGSLAHIDYDVKIGDDTLIEGLVYIPPLSRIGKNVFIGPSAALTNDPYPPSEKLIGVIIEDNAIIGSKAVIKAGVTVGKNSVVAMGAVVINDVPPDTVVAGIPAKPKYSRDEYDKKQSEWKSI